MLITEPPRFDPDVPVTVEEAIGDHQANRVHGDDDKQLAVGKVSRQRHPNLAGRRLANLGRHGNRNLQGVQDNHQQPVEQEQLGDQDVSLPKGKGQGNAGVKEVHP